MCVYCVWLIRPREKSQRADIFLPPRLSLVAAVPELCDICSLTGSLYCGSQRLAHTHAHEHERAHYCSSTRFEHSAGLYAPPPKTHTHAKLNQVNDLSQCMYLCVHVYVCVCVRERWIVWSSDTRVLLGFYHRITGGMLMTKPNYRGLITTTFTKLITAKRRQALQVIHSVGY